MKRVFDQMIKSEKIDRIRKCEFCEYTLNEYKTKLNKPPKQLFQPPLQPKEPEQAPKPLLNYESDEIQSTTSELTDPEDHFMQYLTPELIEIFRHSELYQLSRQTQPDTIQTVKNDDDLIIKDLKKMLDDHFERGCRERNPVLWPVLPMSF